MNRVMPLLLACLGFCFGLGFGCSKPDVITPAQFTRDFVAAIRQADPRLKVEILHDLELKVTAPGGRESHAFLNNAYDGYKRDPAGKETVIHRFVVAGLEAYNAPEEKLDPTRIVPVIKDTAWLEETRQATVARGIDKPLESVHEDFAPGLVVLYAQDSPKTIRYLTPKDVQEAGLDRGRLRRLAVENLGKVLPQIQFRGTNGLYMVIAGGDYETSLLLVDSFWTNGRVQVKGDYVVSIPARGLLFVTGSADPEGVRRLKSVTEEALKQSSYRLTSDLFVYRGGKFQAFQPSVP